MANQPVKPRTHGMVDYVFSGIQMAAPFLLGMQSTPKKIFSAMGGGLLVLNALTDTPYAVKRAIPFKDHQLIDKMLLTTLLRVMFMDSIQKNRKALFFTIGLIGVGLASYVLTDYDAGSRNTPIMDKIKSTFN